MSKWSSWHNLFRKSNRKVDKGHSRSERSKFRTWFIRTFELSIRIVRRMKLLTYDFRKSLSRTHWRSSKVKNRRKNVQFRPLSKVYKFYQNEALDVSFTWLLGSIPRLLVSIIGQEILNGQPRAKRWPKSLYKKQFDIFILSFSV